MRRFTIQSTVTPERRKRLSGGPKAGELANTEKKAITGRKGHRLVVMPTSQLREEGSYLGT